MKTALPSLMFAFALSCVAPLAGVAADTAPAASPTQSLDIPATDDGLPGSGPIRRYDWFKSLWTQRRTEWAQRVQQDQGAIVFLGDSITHYWGDLPQFFTGIKVANRGISGDTTRGVLLRIGDVTALNPKAVVLLIGTNDLDEWGSPEIAASNLKLIVAALHQHNAQLPIVLCKVFPSAQEKNRPAAQIQKMNDLYTQAVADDPQVTVLDTFALFANQKGEAKIEEFPDLLHPNAIGYAKWAAALHPVLETIGVVPAWPDDFSPELGFVSLSNGRDLTGWHYKDQPALDGKTATDDARYVATNGRLVVTVSHKARDYRTLWTTRTFPRDFVLKLEFRASPNADSGVFIRSPQLQCRDFPLAGPFANLKNYRPLDWNEIVVTVRGGLAHATCNGEVLLDAMPVPADGPIGLESDRGQVEYRRIRVSER